MLDSFSSESVRLQISGPISSSYVSSVGSPPLYLSFDSIISTSLSTITWQVPGIQILTVFVDIGSKPTKIPLL